MKATLERNRIPMINRYFRYILVFSILLVGAQTAVAHAGDAPALKPTSEQSDSLKKIMTKLDRYHYRNLPIDNDLSSDLFNRYIRLLDPSRVYLLASDLREFERFRLTLDDALRGADLEPAFEIFSRFQERRVDRMHFLIEAVEKRFDSLVFDLDETLELDRKEVPWIESREEWDVLWFKQFKNDVLNLRIAGREMEDIRDLLSRRYRDRLLRVEEINSADVFRIYMDVYTQGYDPHTAYFPPREAENFDISMRLSYEGIGALLGADGEYIKVVRLIPAGPAEKAGTLKAGDRIAGVAQGHDGDMVDVIGWRVDEVVELIRGPKETVVRLAVIPANQPDSGSTQVVSLTRNEVKLEEQEAKKRIVELERAGGKLKIGLVKLPAFYMDFGAAGQGDPNYKSSTRDVAALLSELKSEGVDGVVIDLQGNGGGSLQEACELTGLFLNGGPVVQVRDAGGRTQVIQNPKGSAVYDGPLVVLVDRLSASASEIFAGAVQDTGRGVVVGSRTFGKGTVQNLNPVAGGQLKVTLAKYYRISGASTQNRGVIPDILFPEIYDPEEIGESAIEEALPWDRVQPIKYKTVRNLTDLLPKLRQRHADRITQDPEFVYFTDRLDYYDKIRSKTLLSLNESVRKKDRETMESDLLAIENKRRKALGEEPIESLDDLTDNEADAESEESEESEDEPDPFTREAVNIAADLVLKTVAAGK